MNAKEIRELLAERRADIEQNMMKRKSEIIENVMKPNGEELILLSIEGLAIMNGRIRALDDFGRMNDDGLTLRDWKFVYNYAVRRESDRQPRMERNIDDTFYSFQSWGYNDERQFIADKVIGANWEPGEKEGEVE